MEYKLTEEEKRILDNFKEVLPKIPQERKERLLIGLEFLSSITERQSQSC